MAKQLLSGRLTSKGQLTIPIELRNLLDLKEGDRIAFVLDDNKKVIDIQPKPKKSIRGVMGILKPTSNVDVGVDEAIDLARTERAKEIVRKMQVSEIE